jgi:hypothetical protein
MRSSAARPMFGKFREDESQEFKRRGYTTIVRLDLSGYASIAALVLDWNGDVRFTLSQVIPDLTLRFRGHISYPRQSSQRRVNHKSGLEGILLQRLAFRQIQLPQNPVSELQIKDQRRDFNRGAVDLVAFLPVI